MGENRSPQAKKRRKLADSLGLLLLICLLPILLPVLLIVGLVFLLYLLLYRTILTLAAWTRLCPRGTNVIFVYSDSPNWKEYLQRNIVDKIQAQSIILNWSNHSQWKRSALPVRIFFHFAGSTEFNPIAILFRPFHRTKVFRFWQAFKDYKHGKTEPLQKVEAEFFEAIKNLEMR
jgi:hypothetical protein